MWSITFQVQVPGFAFIFALSNFICAAEVICFTFSWTFDLSVELPFEFVLMFGFKTKDRKTTYIIIADTVWLS